MPNQHKYNSETRKYENLTVEDLPTMVQIGETLESLDAHGNTLESKVHDMKMKWLSALNLQSSLVVCEVTPQPLITSDKEE